MHKMEMKKNKLKIRVLPIQKRAITTMELILNTAAELLEEVGTDVLTTKLISERADIRIRNVYRYFANKRSVIYALAERMATREAEYLNDFNLVANQQILWHTAIDMTVDAFFKSVKDQPGIISIRRAMKSDPELRQIDENSNKILSKKLALALENRNPGLPLKKLNFICSIILDVSTALLDRAGEAMAKSNESESNEIIDELKRIIRGYLETYCK